MTAKEGGEMKKQFARALAVVLALSPTPTYLIAQSLAEPDYAHIKLEATSTVYKLGKPIIVNIVLSNPTDHNLRFVYMHSDQGDAYKFVVTPVSTSGQLEEPKPLERTDIGKEEYYYVFGGPAPPNISGIFMVGMTGPLQPNHTKVFPTDLARTFKFTEPGTYKVEIADMPASSAVDPITIVVVR